MVPGHSLTFSVAVYREPVRPTPLQQGGRRPEARHHARATRPTPPSSTLRRTFYAVVRPLPLGSPHVARLLGRHRATWPSAGPGRATISSSPGTTSAAGARPSTRLA